MLEDILRQQTTKIIKDRENDKLHASDLSDDFCARREFYRNKNPQIKIQGSFHSWTFSLGRHVEQIIRQELLVKYMFGLWKCGTRYYYDGDLHNCIGEKKYKMYPDGNCVECQAYDWVYEEISFFCWQLGITCSFDGFVEINGCKYLIEIKSMKEDQFKKLEKPLEHHVYRTNMYLNALQYFNEFKVEPKAYIIYCAKSSGIYNQGQVIPFRVFEIDYINIENEIKQKTEGYYKALQTNQAPKGICVSLEQKEAVHCPFALSCFKTKQL